MLQPSTVMRTLEAMGVEDYVLLQAVDGDLVVMVEAEEDEEDHDRVFFSVSEDQAEDYNLVLRPW